MKNITVASTLFPLLIMLAACGGDPASDGGDTGDGGSTPVCDASGIMPQMGTLAELGALLFNDSNLSTPVGQACADCHDPGAGFADPLNSIVSEGAITGRFGNRNAPTAAYASFAPEFTFVPVGGIVEEAYYFGGQFLDGRRDNLIQQAKDPFLNPLEMANPDKASVVSKVCAADYASRFVYLFGSDALENADTAYHHIAEAIAAFEESPAVNQFTSKFDYWLSGAVPELSTEEERGRVLFFGGNLDAEDPKCITCHSVNPVMGEGDIPRIVFTNHTYANLGTPENPANPFYDQDPEFNPAGTTFVDLGLGGAINVRNQDGKFKVPTLRNVAVTGPYMHNGVFTTLEEVVEFYNDRDLGAIRSWAPPEVGTNVNTADMGNLQLTAENISDIVAFLRTLTDGYTPTSP